MTGLVQSSKYGAMNTTDSTTMGYYVINFASEAYTLQEDTKCDEKIITAGEMFVKAQYLSFMKKKSGIGGKKNSSKIYFFLNTQSFFIFTRHMNPCTGTSTWLSWMITEWGHRITSSSVIIGIGWLWRLMQAGDK